MHRSRLAALCIDCNTGDLDAAAAFWSRALGYAMHPPTDPADANYVSLETPPDEVHIDVQKVDHPSRVHIDIEADDIEAEVRRLEALGARRVEQIRTWWVLEAPTGQRFCVVRPQRADFEQRANVWED